jgi:mannose-6-phosphate isomerase-like protein (cupin superfamily)
MIYFKKMMSVLLISLLLLTTAGCVQTEKIDVDNHNEENEIVAEEQNKLILQKEDATKRVNAAIELIEEKGELAFPEFREIDGQWYHDNSYIMIWSTKGIRVVYPPNVSGEGEDVNGLEDYNGKPIGKLFIETALSEKGEGWVNYHWPKPNETKPSMKSTFIKRTSIDDQTYLVGSGFYVDDYVYTNNLEEENDAHFMRFGDISLGNVLHPAVVDMELGVDYSIAHVIMKPGGVIEPHIMKNPEAHYVLAGEGVLYIEDVPFELSEGQLVLIPANSKQYTENNGEIDLEFFAIDQPAWSKENEVILE